MSESKNKYSQGQRVYFSLGENLPSGWGKIAGVQGLVIVIELETPIKDYIYTHIYIIDTQIVDPPAAVKA